MEEQGLFEIKDESKVNQVTPLVNEPYTYENMVNNPIIKPIAECDKSLRDLDEIIYKKLIDIKRLKEKQNNILEDVPSYQDSAFISDLIKLIQALDDVIKVQDVQLANTKDCIKNIANEVRERYGVKEEDSGDYVEPTTVIPEGNVANYLDKLCAHQDETISMIANKIKEILPTITKGKDDKEKFELAVVQYYKTQMDKTKKPIIAKIMRMEI
jgi:hypothetical protein